jgi:hypothetical protein
MSTAGEAQARRGRRGAIEGGRHSGVRSATSGEEAE